MTDGLNIGIAFLAGILSFLSPCVLPLIPSYIAIMGGTTLQALKGPTKKKLSAFKNTVFFVIGFSIVFIALGVLFTATFGLLAGVGQVINIVAGLIVIVLGLHFIFDFWKILDLEKRFHLKNKPAGALGSMLFGLAFGAGWSPCVGPILGSILLMAGTTGTLVQGIFLLFVYSAGLGLPFLLTGLFFSFALKQLNKIKPHLSTIQKISGGFLILIGILILLGRLQRLNILLAVLSQNLYSWDQANPLLSRIIFGIVFLLIGAVILFSYIRRMRVDSKQTEAEPLSSSSEDTGTNATSKLRLIKPIRILLILAAVAFSVLTFTGALNFAGHLASWISFQGL
jgi:cytochrome c-type biogenesis protein